MSREARLRGQISIIVAIGTLIVAVGVALVLSNTVDLRDTSKATAQADEYLAATANLERLVVDAETGLRGYVITRRPLFLAPTRQAEARLPGANAALRASAAANGAFAQQAAELISETRLYFSTYLPQVIKLAARNPAAARTYQTTLAGKRQVDAIRAQAAQLEGLVSAREATRQLAAKHTANRSIAEAIIVLVALTLLTALLGGWLGRVAVERERARQRSERTSQSLQESILPAHIPTVPACQLAVRFTPEGGGTVGGDFYDVFEVADGGWAVVVGDVCGKGAAAAAISAMARWTLRGHAASTTSAAEALRRLNDVMLRQCDDGRFVTIAYLLITVTGQHARAEIACAGHRSRFSSRRAVTRGRSGPAATCLASGPTFACSRSSSSSSGATALSPTPMASPIKAPGRSGCRRRRWANARPGLTRSGWPESSRIWRPIRPASGTTSRSWRCASPASSNRRSDASRQPRRRRGLGARRRGTRCRHSRRVR